MCDLTRRDAWIDCTDEWLDSIVDRATRTRDVSVRIAEEAG